MPTKRVTETTVYKFAELSDSAKDRARDKVREWACDDSFWYESIFEDAVECARIIGIETDSKHIYFSGFSSQGDGASLSGRYSYVKGASKAIKAHAPQDARLHAIAEGLQAIQRKHFYKAGLAFNQSGRYVHEMTMQFDDTGETEMNQDDFDDMCDLLRDFARWIYRTLEREYDYQNSNKAIDETILANDYDFNEEGRIV